MSFNSELASLSRKRQDIVVLSLDSCNNTWGVAQCTASAGGKCYNTYTTCADKPNFNKRSKKYYFTNAGALNFNVPEARPYITSISDLTTEIKENGTVTKRLKVKFHDEPELTDTMLDKNFTDRTTITGNFWHKLIARNPNYKGRIIELFEGFDSLAFADYRLRFVGKIVNITMGNGWCEIEAIDLLRSLEDIEFPSARNIKLVEKMYRMFNNVTSQAEMLALPAGQYDYCIRFDFANIVPTITPVTGTSPVFTSGTFTVHIYAYDTLNKVIGYGSDIAAAFSGSPFALEIDYTILSAASYYRIYVSGAGVPGTYTGKHLQTVTTPQIIGQSTDTLKALEEPSQAERYFELTGTDPTNNSDWTERHTSYDIDVDDAIDLDSAGYFQVDEEIVYYGSKSSNTLQGLSRGALSTNSETTHESGTQLYTIASPATGNPFQVLQDLLTLGGIDSAYVATAFTTLEAAWTGINFSFLPYSKKKKLSDIYFNAVRSLDCISWVSENGKITIKELSDTTVSGDLNDTENIVSNSLTKDLNEESRFTRWLIHWNRFDGTLDLDDSESYNNLTILIDADAESVNSYNDKKEDEFFSAFIADTGNGTGAAATYIVDLQTTWKTRTKQAQELVTLAVELKDNIYIIGDVISLTTSKIQDINGVGYSAVEFLIIKKEPQGSRIKLTMKRIY